MTIFLANGLELAIATMVFVNLAISQDVATGRLQDLSRRSDACVYGVIVGRTCELGSDQTAILTILDVRVNKWLLGSSVASSIKIEMAGGRVGNLVEVVTHQPKFDIGDELVLFLLRSRKQTADLYRVNLSGKYNVEVRNNRKRVYNDTGDSPSTRFNQESESILLDEAISIIENSGRR